MSIPLRIEHPEIGRTRVFMARELVIGRSGGLVDLELNWDARVSRRHARLWLSKGALWIHDLASKNGSWVESQPICGPVRLEQGWSVVIGTTRISLAEKREAAFAAFPSTQSSGDETADLEVRDSAAPEAMQIRAMERARALILAAEKYDFYKALCVCRQSSTQDLANAIDATVNSLVPHVSNSSGEGRSLLVRALQLLSEMTQTLGDRERRLAYDLKRGHVQAEARLLDANDNGMSVERLREVWSDLHPGNIDRASKLMTEAFAARRRRDYRAAIDLGDEALELDPFHLDFRRSVAVWRPTLHG